MLAHRTHAASRTVGVAFVFADIHHQARIECTTVQTIGEAELYPVRMLAGDRVAAGQDLRLDSCGHVHEIDAAAARICWSGGWFRIRFFASPVAKDFFDGFQHFVRIEIAN